MYLSQGTEEKAEKIQQNNDISVNYPIKTWKIGLQNDRERQVNKKKTEKIAKDAEVKKRILGGWAIFAA